MVSFDGAAERGPKLIAFERCLLIREEISRLQFLVADVLVKAAVEIVRSALQRGVDDRGKSIFGTHSPGLHLEFFQGIGGGRDTGCPKFAFGDVKTIVEPAARQSAAAAETQADAGRADTLSTGSDI